MTRTLLLVLALAATLPVAAYAQLPLPDAPRASQVARATSRPAAVPEPYGIDQTWTSRDKFYHFAVSGLGAAAVYGGARLLGIPRWAAMGVSVGLVGAAGVMRELGDERRPGKYFSEKDLFWNGIGIAVGIAVPDQLLFGRREAAESQ